MYLTHRLAGNTFAMLISVKMMTAANTVPSCTEAPNHRRPILPWDICSMVASPTAPYLHRNVAREPLHTWNTTPLWRLLHKSVVCLSVLLVNVPTCTQQDLYLAYLRQIHCDSYDHWYNGFHLILSVIYYHDPEWLM